MRMSAIDAMLWGSAALCGLAVAGRAGGRRRRLRHARARATGRGARPGRSRGDGEEAMHEAITRRTNGPSPAAGTAAPAVEREHLARCVAEQVVRERLGEG